MSRKPRKLPKEHKNIDLLSPVDLLKLGGDEDPCFGKLYSLKAEECKRCNDSEFCQIKMAQSMIKITDKQEKKNQFKDVQEAQLVESQNEQMVNLMVKRANKNPGKWLRIERVIPLFIEKFSLTDKETDIVAQRIIREIQKTKKLKLNKQLTKYTI